RTAAQRVDQLVLLDDLAARRVDDDRRALHARQLASADQAVRRFGQRNVQRNDVGLLDQVVERDTLDVELERTLVGQVRITHDDVHAEGTCASCNLSTDAPCADETERLAVKLEAREALEIGRASCRESVS